MAATRGVLEPLMPTADKRKRRRKDQGVPPVDQEPLPTSSTTAKATDGGECSNGPKQKKTKMETRSSTSKSELPAPIKTETKTKIDNAVLADNVEFTSIKSPASKEGGDGLEWRSEDRIVLLDQIHSVLPADDNVKYSTMADKLGWSKVKVGDFSPDACKEEWLRISTKLRRFRTLSELLVDAKAWMKHPWNAFGKKTTKHPDMPKKPLTPYFRFFMAKRQKYSAKHPKMGVTDLTKELSKKYQNLSEKKKKKYIDSYNKEMEDWKSAMIQFRKHHPEAFDDDDKQGTALHKHSFHGAPPKSTTAMQLYINEKYSEEKGTDVSRKQMYEKFKTEWFGLSDLKKLKYIKLAIDAKERYDTAMLKYRLEHPEYTPRHVKSFLSKAEQKIKDHFDGKPEKPPVNGYSLFTVETLHLLTDMPNIERLGEVSRRWKKLSEDKREAYNLKADERNQEFRVKYAKYLKGLPDDERKKLEEEETDKKKKQLPSSSVLSTNSAAVERPQKPIAAVFLFINDKKEDYRKKNPEMDDNELQRLLVKEYNCLSEKEKIKYKKLEEEEKQKVAQESVPPSNKRVKKTSFPGEPPKPPHSGYQLFSKELLTQLKDVKANERLQEIGRRWLALSEEEKQQHNRHKDLMWTQYRKDLEKFKKNLSAKDRKQFEELNMPSKKKRISKKDVPEEEDESSSDEEEADEEAEDNNGSSDGSSSEADTSSSEEEDDEDDDAKSCTSESMSDDDSESGSESEEEEEEEEKRGDENQTKKSTSANGNNIQTQGKAGRLSAKDVYNDSSNESSSEDSDSGDSSSSST